MKPTSTARSKVQVEEQKILWTIENFNIIRKNTSMVNSQSLDFTAGETLGHPTNWRLSLRQKAIGERIAFFCTKLDPAPTSKSNVCAQVKVFIDGGNWMGTCWPYGDSGIRELSSFSGYGFALFWSSSSRAWGKKVTIEVKFKCFVSVTPDGPVQPKKGRVDLEGMKSLMVAQARKDLEILRWNLPSSDIKILTKDKEFPAQKEIIAARCPVLAAMIRSSSVQANSKLLLPDISSKALHVLLIFLNNGELHPDWSDPGVVVELTAAAAKFQLQDLLKFLDVAVGQICKLENVLALYKLAHQLALKTAEVELLKFIRENGVADSESFAKLLSAEEVEATKKSSLYPNL